MDLVYVDDSGDQHAQVLGVIMIPEAEWLDVHDELVAFRRDLSKRLGFRMARELKATQIVSNGGPWRRLGVPTRTRLGVYRAALRLLADLGDSVSVFGVVAPDRNDPNLRESPVADTWNAVFERLERHSTKSDVRCFLLPDEGNPATVRKLARQRRRFAYAPSAFGGRSQKVPFRRLIEDPAHRDSSLSYEMQWADLVAYAAFRRVVPRGDFPPTMWETLGDALHLPVNQINRRRGIEPPALLVWPGRRLP